MNRRVHQPSKRCAAWLAALGMLAGRATAQQARERTYSSAEDFAQGFAINLEVASARDDRLQLARSPQPLPFIHIACSARGTVVRVDVESGAVLGEYATAPEGMARNPSRTTVDRLGNVWVCNRDENGRLDGEQRGSVARIGLVIGGTRGTKDPRSGAFRPDVRGEYLKGPFRYSTCVDRDGDGLIRTSFGLGCVLAWSNADGVDSAGGVASADDECIVDYTRVAGANARTLAIDANNDVWVGGWSDQDHEKLDGVSGRPIAGTLFNFGCGGYGGFVDGNGVLWSARGGTGLLRYDTRSGTGVSLGNECGDYGLALDPVTGNVWHTSLYGGTVGVLSPAGECTARYGYGSVNAQGLAVDARGNVWIAHSLWGATTIGHLRADGSFVGNVALTHATGNGNGPTGVSIDTHGKVWVACVNSNNALRIDPNAGALGPGGVPLGAVDLVVELGESAGPYNYSDMTGWVVLAATQPGGAWTLVEDSGRSNQRWAMFAWHSDEPEGTRVTIEVRADDDPTRLAAHAFSAVRNGAEMCASGIVGRYLELRATLMRDHGVSATPELLDITTRRCEIAARLVCPPNFVETAQADPDALALHPDRTGWASYADDCPQGVKLEYADEVQPRGAADGPLLELRRTWTLTDACGTRETCTQMITSLAPGAGDGALTLDIEPGACPNIVTLGNSTSTRIALVSTWLHEAAGVRRASLALRRADGVGRRLYFPGFEIDARHDVARPFYGTPGDCSVEPGDGRRDAQVTLPSALLASAFQLDKLPAGASVEIELVGQLDDGTSFSARDWIEVR